MYATRIFFTKQTKIVLASAFAFSLTILGGQPQAFAGECEYNDPLIVSTTSGDFQGFMDENGTLAWKGIPYARPPVGWLRWKAPRSERRLHGVRQATEDPCPCSQLGISLSPDSPPDVIGEEDCLYLNVWRPDSVEDDLPVYVWIHGGGNIGGQASFYPGDALAQQANAVVVVIQYRLGPLGWFSHPALRAGRSLKNASGNYGTLDIIQALRWVRRNVARFGGDRDNVTIAGESAGAHNVSSMMVSPLARGLFHKAIHQSSGLQAQDVERSQTNANSLIDALLVDQGLASDLAEAEGIRTSWSLRRLRRFLLSQTTEDLIAKFWVHTDNLGFNGMIIDGHVIPSSFLCAIQSGHYNRVPILLGTNEEEMKLWITGGYQGTPDYTPLVGAFLDPTLTFNDILPTEADKRLFEDIALHTSRMWTATHGDANARALAQQHNDVYSYQFNWGGEGDRESDPAFIHGATHALAIPFFFGKADDTDHDPYGFWNLDLPESRPGKVALGDAVVGYLSSFIRNGAPGDGGIGLEQWPQWSNADGGPKSLILDADNTNAILQVSTESRTIEDVRMDIEELDAITQQGTLSYISLIQHFSSFEIGDIDAGQDCQ